MLCSHPPFSSHDSLSLSSHILLPLANNGALSTSSRCKFPLPKAMAMDGHLQMDAQAVGGGSGMSHNCRLQASRAVSLRDESRLLIPSTWVFDEASLATDSSISCTTFNILAPIYKRVNGEEFRESQFRESWLSRNQKILDMLLLSKSSIICLQELWLGNEELTRLYEENLCQADYLTYKLARTNNRGDGLLTAIKSSTLRVLDYKKLLFHDCGDRVAQVFHIQSRVPCLERSQSAGLELLLVNTHLLFPHDFNYCLVRLRQVFKILKFIEQYKIEHGLTSIPVILSGDWNGSKRGRVYKFLHSQGYLSSYDTVRDYSDADSHRWISHRNHRGNVCKVDFIWLLNPGTEQKPLLSSWHEAVLGTIKARLSQLGLDGREAFSFFKSDNGDSVMTLEEFQQGLRQLGLTEACVAECSEGLTDEEIEQLMRVVDIDGNGVIDYDEFKMLLVSEGADVTIATKGMNASGSSVDVAVSKHEEEEKVRQTAEKEGKLERHGSFVVKEASLFPPEAEDGVWPEDYSLSDHAALTVTFTSPRDCSDVY